MKRSAIRLAVIGISLALALALCAGCRHTSQSSALPSESIVPFERDLSIARLAERHDEVQKAKDIYLSVLTKEPRHQESLHRLGVIAAREGRFDQAILHLSSAIAADDPSAELMGDLGYVYYQKGNYGLAEEKLNQALDMDARDERLLNNLGLVLAAQKKYARALVLFQQVGTMAEAYANLAFAQSQQGELAAAEANYHRALEEDPATKIAAVGLVELRKQKRLRRTRMGRVETPFLAQYEHRRQAKDSPPSGDHLAEVPTPDYGDTRSVEASRSSNDSAIVGVYPGSRTAVEPPPATMPVAAKTNVAACSPGNLVVNQQLQALTEQCQELSRQLTTIQQATVGPRANTEIIPVAHRAEIVSTEPAEPAAWPAGFDQLLQFVDKPLAVQATVPSVN